MSDRFKRALIDRMSGIGSAIGLAPAERFRDAPEKHHSNELCRNARAVIVLGITVAKGIAASPDYHLYALQGSYRTTCRRLYEVSLELCMYIESFDNHHAVPVPSCAPMVFQGMEPWGILSLKHAAVFAGLGQSAAADRSIIRFLEVSCGSARSSQIWRFTAILFWITNPVRHIVWPADIPVRWTHWTPREDSTKSSVSPVRLSTRYIPLPSKTRRISNTSSGSSIRQPANTGSHAVNASRRALKTGVREQLTTKAFNLLL